MRKRQPTLPHKQQGFLLRGFNRGGSAGGSGVATNAFIDWHGETSMALFFPKVDGAMFYRIRRSLAGAGIWTEIGTAYASVGPMQYYAATGLSTNVSYDFQTRPEDEDHNLIGSWSGTISGTTVANEPDVPVYPAIVDTKYSLPSGNLWTVTTATNNQAGTGPGNRTDCGLQYAIDNCERNDVIRVTHTLTITGPIVMKEKTTGSGWIYIQTSAYDSLPGPRNRVTVSDRAFMPIITHTSNSVDCIMGKDGAQYYRFVGIAFTHAATPFSYGLFNLSLDENGFNQTVGPNHIIIDRCSAYGHATLPTVRAFAFAGQHMAVIDSDVRDIWDNNDTQAFYTGDHPGPYLFRNNYTNISGENIMIGGGNPFGLDPARIPRDIMFMDNVCDKDDAWSGSPVVVIKNCFELKLGIRVVAQYNDFRNSYDEGQSGVAVTITPRDQNDSNAPPYFPDAEVSNVAMVFNKAPNCAWGFSIAGVDGGDGNPARTSKRVEKLYISHFWAHARDARSNGGGNRGFSITGGVGISSSGVGGPKDMIIRHTNVFLRTGDGGPITNAIGDGTEIDRARIVDNIFDCGAYGWVNDWTGNGPLNALDSTRWNSNYSVTRNLWINRAATGIAEAQWPAGNFFPANFAAVGFTDYQYANTGNFRLSAGSAYKGTAPDGQDPGCNFDWVPT